MNSSQTIMVENQRGVTLVELIMVVVIMGILAIYIAPRLNSDVFSSRGFADEVKATLRHAQKVAIAQHRTVCVAFASDSITLTHTNAACPGGALSDAAGETPYTVTAPPRITLSGGAFSFNALGRPSAGSTVTVAGGGSSHNIVVEAETGYVH